MIDWMMQTVKSTLGPATVQLKKRTTVRTATGGTTYTWADSGTPQPCTLATMNADEMELAGRMAVRGTMACRVAADFDVDEADRLVVAGTGMDELDGQWEVTAVLTGAPVVDRLLYLARST